MATFDAVIPAFNPQPGWLERAIGSLVPCVAFGLRRIIVVDDGSNPPIQRADFAPSADGDELPLIELLRQTNAGPSAARNRALDHVARSGGEWVLMLDADDRAIPTGVRAMLTLAERFKAAGVVPARIHHRAESGSVRESTARVPEEWIDRPIPGPSEVFRPISLFSATGALVSCGAIKAGLRFDESLRLGEDRDFFCRLAQTGPLVACGEPALFYVEHGGGGVNLTSGSHMARRIRDHAVLMDRYVGKDDRARQHFQEATRWLVNAASKSEVDDASWEALLRAARRHGYSVAMKPRVRRAMRGFWRTSPARLANPQHVRETSA